METDPSHSGPASWQAVLRTAMDAHRTGRLADADRAYAEVLKAVPEHVQALRLRGVLARERGDLELSARLLRKAVEADPKDPDPAAELGLSYLAMGYLQLAEQALRRALAADPDSIRALANLGALLQYRGHGDEAVACHRRVLDLEPGDLEVRCNLANTLLEIGRGTDALAECDRGLAMAPGHPLLLAARGAALCGLDRYGEAVPDLELALTRNSRDDMALINLALARSRLGDEAAAEEVLRRALKINADNARACSDLVMLLTGGRRAGEAVHVAEEFLARHPGERLVLGALAYAYRDAGQSAAAASLLEDLRLVVVSDPDIAPRGFPSMAALNLALEEAIEADPTLLENPLSKSTRAGYQTAELNLQAQPAYAALEALLRNGVRHALATYDAAGFGDHPLMAVATERWTLRAWATVLPAGGRQIPHMHPLAWLSGVYYVDVPAMSPLAGEDASDPLEATGAAEAGWLEFGAPPARLKVTAPPVLRRVEPRPGRLVLFPSWFYHRTLPFQAAASRISIAFDVMPVR